MSPDFMKNYIDFPFHINLSLPSPHSELGCLSAREQQMFVGKFHHLK
jgi:hypothetical protein